jgi:hypothetical protein
MHTLVNLHWNTCKHLYEFIYSNQDQLTSITLKHVRTVLTDCNAVQSHARHTMCDVTHALYNTAGTIMSLQIDGAQGQVNKFVDQQTL